MGFFLKKLGRTQRKFLNGFFLKKLRKNTKEIF